MSANEPRVPRSTLPLHVAALASAAVATLFVVLPFLPWIVLALWTSGLAIGLREPVVRVTGGRRRAAAAIALLLVLAFLVPLALTIVPFAMDGVALVRRLLAASDTRRMLESLVSEGGPEVPPDLSASGVARFVGDHGARAWQVVRAVTGATGRAMAGVAVFAVVAYGRLAEGEEIYTWIERHTPVDPKHLARVASAFNETGRGLFVGMGGAALVQGALATIAYAAVGVPHAFVLGVLTLFAALVPGVGTALIWAPVAVGLALTGRTTPALIVAAVGIALVSTIDNVLKPLLMRYGRLELSASILFVAMLGGVLMLGPAGLLLGPVAVRIAKELVVVAREEREKALSTSPG